MKKYLILALLLATPVQADELTLNDIPLVLKKLNSSKSYFVIEGNRKVDIFYKNYNNELIVGHGTTVLEALTELSFKLNKQSTKNKEILKNIGDLIPTQ